MKKLYSFVAVLFTLTMSGQTFAAPTVQLWGGKTTVTLDGGFLDALDSNNIVPGVVGPATLKGAKARFPIPGGAIDGGSFRGDIYHNGGLTLTCGDTEVKLVQFIIDTTQVPVVTLTGLVAVNDTIDGTVPRVPLFDLTLNELPKVRGNRVKIRNVDVKLSATAAGALSALCGVGDLTGAPVGVAKVRTTIVDDSSDDDSSD